MARRIFDLATAQPDVAENAVILVRKASMSRRIWRRSTTWMIWRLAHRRRTVTQESLAICASAAGVAYLAMIEMRYRDPRREVR